MAGKTSKAPTQPPGEALSPKHEAFVQAYVSRGMNGTKAYRAISDKAAAAVAEVWQTANGALRVKLHDKHAALVSIGKHLGMFVDRVQIQERKQISAEPMSAEEWKRQYVREG